ncbi:MAG: hypothetical protein PHD95_07025 [Candidatus ainarchaeum sp.]|nr:hypothetical protein [Candidatus ainarchaeum sp.]
MNAYCETDFKNFSVKKGGKTFCHADFDNGLCFSALYSAVPYLLSFSRGSWFSWEKDKNAVTAVCSAGIIAMEIRKLENKMQIRITKSFGNCARNHKEGDLFFANKKDFDWNAFNSIFPFLFVGTKKTKIKICASDSDEAFEFSGLCKKKDSFTGACGLNSSIKENASVRVSGMARKCRYQKKAGQRYSFEELMPKNFCAFAYCSAYPLALSLIYNGRPLGLDSRIVFCPGCSNRVKMEIFTRQRRMAPVYNLAEKAFRFFGIPQDVIERKAVARAVEVTGKCPAGIKKGFEIEFNFNDQKKICPASLYTLLPLLAGEGEGEKCSCPSILCRVEYEVK